MTQADAFSEGLVKNIIIPGCLANEIILIPQQPQKSLLVTWCVITACTMTV